MKDRDDVLNDTVLTHLVRAQVWICARMLLSTDTLHPIILSLTSITNKYQYVCLCVFIMIIKLH